MKATSVLFSIAALGAASPALAEGRIGTLAPGAFICELPGDAAGPAGLEQPEENFAILSGSRYRTAKGSGTYLLSRDKLQMTSGPKKGNSYLVESSALLKKFDRNGSATRLRCVRS